MLPYIMPYIFITLIILSAALEYLCGGRRWIFLLPGALAGFILTLSGAAVYTAVASFALISPVLLTLYKISAKACLNRRGKYEREAEGLYPRVKSAVVISRMSGETDGKILAEGSSYAAKPYYDEDIEAGEVVFILCFEENGRAVCERYG